MQVHQRFWVAIEALLLSLVIFFHWFPNTERALSCLLFIPLIIGRLLVTKKLIARTPLDFFLVAFVILCIANVTIAPFSWGYYTVGRAAMGVGIVWVIGGWTEVPNITARLLAGLLIFGVMIGIVGLFTSQYTAKSIELQLIIDILPKFYNLPVITGGFNVNEIGGALTFFATLSLALAINGQWVMQARWRAPGMVLAVVAFTLLLSTLLLGQSRMAMIGVLLASGVVIVLLIPAGRRRFIALCAYGVLVVLEVILAFNLLVPADQVAVFEERDQTSVTSRLDIYQAALAVARDYPLTGVGVNEFRSRQVRALYPVPGYENKVLPHAHNNFLQLGTDLGIPGMLFYIGLNATVAGMLWRVWRRGVPDARVGAVAVASGLVAHGIFGVGDAITFFDRFIFIYWLFVAVAAVLYLQLKPMPPNTESHLLIK